MDIKTKNNLRNDLLDLKRRYDLDYNELKKLIDEEKERTTIPDVLEADNRKYYYISPECLLEQGNSYATGGDRTRFVIHNAFLSKEYAEMVSKQYRLLLLKNWFKWNSPDRDLKPDNDEEHRFYYVVYNKWNKFTVESTYRGEYSNNEVYFSTMEIAYDCADWLNSLTYSRSCNE